MDRRNYFLAFIVLACSLVVASLGACEARAAEVIQFPDEELATESVLPVFDHPVSVKNRSVVTAKRFELGVIGGLSLLEPFYNPMSFGATFSYHFNEEHAINITGNYFMQGLSSNANNLNPIPNSNPPTNVNLQYAPAPQYMLLADYQYTAFYGKISISKEFVMNLSLYGLGGLGVFAVGDSLNPAGNLGLGQKFYFSPNFALRADLRFVAYNGPDVLSRKLDKVTAVQPASSFGTKVEYVSLLTFGAVFLFPGL